MWMQYFIQPEITADFMIDTFQSIKKGLTDKIITDKTLNKAAHDYINAQTAFAKMLTHNAVDIAKYSADSITNVWFPKQAEKATARKKPQA